MDPGSQFEFAAWLVRERGMSVIPLDHPADTCETDPKRIGKVPALASWKCFQFAPPTDTNLRHGFGSDRPRNVGIVTGTVSGVIVVDCDSSQAESWASVRRMAKAAMRQRYRDAARVNDDDLRGRTAKWSITSESRTRLDNLLYLAQSEPPLSDTGQHWDHDPWLLACRNGVIDLRDGTLREGTPSDRLTRRTSVPYDSHSPCARWLRFLREVFREDDELIAYLQRAWVTASPA